MQLQVCESVSQQQASERKTSLHFKTTAAYNEKHTVKISLHTFMYLSSLSLAPE